MPVDQSATSISNSVCHACPKSIKICFHTVLVRPTLWICAFALRQGDAQLLEKQIGTGSMDESPFVKALSHAKMFVVVRNSVIDLYRYVASLPCCRCVGVVFANHAHLSCVIAVGSGAFANCFMGDEWAWYPTKRM